MGKGAQALEGLRPSPRGLSLEGLPLSPGKLPLGRKRKLNLASVSLPAEGRRPSSGSLPGEERSPSGF